jgi:hypothetical protein
MGAGQPSGGYNSHQGLGQSNTAGKLSPPVGPESEQEGRGSIIGHVTGRGCNRDCNAGRMEGKNGKGDRMRKPNGVFSSDGCPTSDMLTAAIFRH